MKDDFMQFVLIRFVLIAALIGLFSASEIRAVQKTSKTGQKTKALKIQPEKVEKKATAGSKSAVVTTTDNRPQVVVQLGHSGYISSAVFSPDGKYVLTGSNDHTVVLWEVETGKEVRRFAGEAYWIISIGLSPDVKYVLAGGIQKALLLDIATGKQLMTFEGHSGFVSAVLFTRDGKRVLTVGGDEIILWELATGKEIRRFTGHRGDLSAAQFSNDDKRFVVGGSDSIARLWETETGREIRRFSGHTNGITDVQFSPDNRTLLTSSNDKTARLWDVASGQEIRKYEGYSSFVEEVDFSADGKLMLTVGSDEPEQKKKLRIWDVESGKPIKDYGSDKLIFCATFSPDGKNILAGLSGMAELFDINTGKEMKRFVGQVSSISNAAFSDNGNYIVVKTKDRTITAWDVVDGKQIGLYRDDERKQDEVAYTPDQKFAFVGGDKTARYYELATKKVIREFAGHTDRITSVALSADSNYALTGSYDRTARLWEIATGKEILRLGEHPFSVSAVAFSPDGKRLLTGCLDRVARLWDVESGKEMQRFSGHTYGIATVAFSPDGNFILTGSGDCTTRLWDAASGKERCKLISFNDNSWVAVTPEGYFDTNDLEELEGLHWVMPDEPLKPQPLEIFMRDYYEPRLLARLLGGEQLSQKRGLEKLNRAQPEVKIHSIERQQKSDFVTVTVEVAGTKDIQNRPNRSTKVYDLRLFRDGQLIGQYADGKAQSAVLSVSDEQSKLLAWRKEFAVETPTNGKRLIKFDNIRLPRKADVKQVQFSAYAFNEDRVKSRTDKKAYTIPADLQPLKGRAYVILFGVNAYENTYCDLDYAANDVREIQRTVIAQLKQSGQYEDVIETALISDYEMRDDQRRLIKSDATKNNLKTALDLLSDKAVDAAVSAKITGAEKLRQARPEDTVLLFFSSHGYADDAGNFFIVPYDIGKINLCNGEAQMNREEYRQFLSRCISSDELSQWLRYVDAGEMAMIIDACHSAAAVRSQSFKPGPMGSRGLGQLAYDKGMKILAATQEDNVALEAGKAKQGLLSYALTRQGIEEGRADFKPQDSKVTLTEWLLYGVEQVPKLYIEIDKESGKQTNAKGLRVVKQIQRPTLFDFTRRKSDLILFTKPASGQ